MTSQTLFFAGISVKLYAHIMRKKERQNLRNLPESVVVIELRKVCPQNKAIKLFLFIDDKKVNLMGNIIISRRR